MIVVGVLLLVCAVTLVGIAVHVGTHPAQARHPPERLALRATRRLVVWAVRHSVSCMQELLLALGLILFLLGLLTDMAIPLLKNPRMGLASHLQGMTNGPFLVLIGGIWPQVQLPHLWQVIAVTLLIYGTYASWLATQLGALWGAGSNSEELSLSALRAEGAAQQLAALILVIGDHAQQAARHKRRSCR